MSMTKDKNERDEIYDVEFSRKQYSIMGRLGGLKCHDFLEVIYIKSGEAEFLIDESEYVVESGGVILIRPREEYFIESLSQRLDYESVKIEPRRLFDFSSSFVVYKKELARLLDDREVCRVYNKNEIESLKIDEVLNECENEWDKRESGFEYIIKADMLKILVCFLRNNINEREYEVKDDEKAVLIHRTIAYMEENFGEVTATVLAEYCGLSYNYFLKIFKEVMGCGFGKFLQDKRLDESQKLLIETNKTITEIAMEVGFSTTSHFIKFFKEAMGVTPKKYRIGK